MKIRVNVKLKEGVLDPQGKAILHAAHALGQNEIQEIRVGKSFDLVWEGSDKKTAEEKIKKLSATLLANTVIEDFQIEIA